MTRINIAITPAANMPARIIALSQTFVKFYLALQVGFSKPQRRHGGVYVGGSIVCQGKHTLGALSAAVVVNLFCGSSRRWSLAFSPSGPAPWARRALRQPNGCELVQWISDQLWLEGARHYRTAGYHPFTANTGNIPRSASLLREVNWESDAWQVALCLSRDFMDLTRRGATFETRREPITGRWEMYTNGGAVDTWVTPAFGRERPAAYNAAKREALRLLASPGGSE